ncbi:MAG: UDP-N-acetylglucosamine 2-epimerase (non-hydrolyzing) [Bacteroidetes bacterium]|nr:UDP-N-acetylglucosamine 2-epimerase (non-hydrolyzing) [Bacteroidota bacterium]
MHITIIAGTRPNFVKVSPILNELRNQKVDIKLEYSFVHTGQHYDAKLSSDIFKDLDLPTPDTNLEIGSGTQSEQTAALLIRFEEYLLKNQTDAVLVVGDVNSTMACAIVAKKMNKILIHVEAGIRSGDNSMPEEINRKIVDSITDLFFTTTNSASNQLIKEGVPRERIHFVGNVMIDSLINNNAKSTKPKSLLDFDLDNIKYLTLTLHRPKNVDQLDQFITYLRAIDSNCDNVPVFFPTHPRVKDKIGEYLHEFQNIRFIEPLSYLEFNYLMSFSFGVITDSGGISEETTVLNIPCLTLRDNTERPETVDIGTNVLVGTNPNNLKYHLQNLFSGSWKIGSTPELWDGLASKRIISILQSNYSGV